eukprot:scaffold22677_cov105-Isochrysis_galbana.AAC.9
MAHCVSVPPSATSWYAYACGTGAAALRLRAGVRGSGQGRRWECRRAQVLARARCGLPFSPHAALCHPPP